MIILDTNVVSEPLKPQPDPAVLQWLNAQLPETLYLTTITVAELLAGADKLPAGRRKAELHDALIERILPLFDGRVLSFDLAAARTFAKVSTRSRAAGCPISFADGAIAAIACAQGFILATRNVKDFSDTGIELINPWTSGA
ncbi:MAG: type II toxin-antitoxin system VapC family toxin [Rhodoferax sp.]|nr:type II toxin-antitoxin system VapC family toxin [Rhodoferax sp.]